MEVFETNIDCIFTCVIQWTSLNCVYYLPLNSTVWIIPNPSIRLRDNSEFVDILTVCYTLIHIL